MPIEIYPGGDHQFSPNLHLGLWGTDEVTTDNFLLIDAAFGGVGGIEVNGVLVPPTANFINSASVTFGVVGSNITLTAASGPVSFPAVSHEWLNSYSSVTGLFTAAQPAASDLSNGTTGTGAVVLASAIAGFGSGTVTTFSAGNVDSIITSSVATPTTTPALTFALATQTANTVWAGPTTGAAATPTFRALVAADIPAITVPWSSLGNAAANLTLANGAFNTTFDQTAPAVWTWANTTAATVAYLKRVPLVLGTITGTLTNFPVLVSVTVADLATVANGGHVQNASGYDIIFSSTPAGSGSGILPFEVISYSATTGKLVAYVQVPSAATGTQLYILYDNGSISTDQSSAAAVWSNGYLAVYHFGSKNGT